MPEYTGVVIESQVDYLRCSAHGRDAARNMLDLALGLHKEEAARGNKDHRYRLQGYEGISCGRVAYGQRDQNSTILDLSGDAANECLRVALSLADAVTRVDLATTWRCDPPDPHLGPNAYSMACQWWNKNQHRARPSHHQDASGGYTMNLGSRQSPYFFRLYDKQAECIENRDYQGIQRYQGCWRYELEVKGPDAKNIAETVNEETDRYRYVRTYLYNYCQQHGIEPAFAAWGEWNLLPGFRRRSDDDTSIAHLAKNVAPTIARLASHGRLADALRALRLEDSNPPLTRLGPQGSPGPDSMDECGEGSPPKEGESDA